VTDGEHDDEDALHQPATRARDPRPRELQDPRPPRSTVLPPSTAGLASSPLLALVRARLCSTSTARGHDSVAARRDLVLQLGWDLGGAAPGGEEAIVAAGLRPGGAAKQKNGGKRQGALRSFQLTVGFCI
jgi:hypothetical protein